MMGIADLLVQVPQQGVGIWSSDCPDMRTSQIGPQADLLNLNPGNEVSDRCALFIPPQSGHSSALIQDIAKPLCQEMPTYVVNWLDPAFLPFAHAKYGIDTQVDIIRIAIEGLLKATTGPVHVCAVCQAGPPTLLALDSLHTARVTLTLIAAPLCDAPGGVSDLFIDAEQTNQALSQIKSLTTPAINGVRILPGPTQLLSILNGSGGAMRLLQTAMTHEVMPVFSAGSRRSTMRRMALLDAQNISQELLISGLVSNFVHRTHLKSRIDSRIPIHLISGEADQVVPYEQSFDLKEFLPNSQISTSLFSKFDHFDLFSSAAAREQVSPLLVSFFEEPEKQVDRKF